MMKFKSYIDYILYKVHEENSYILVSGWAFEGNDINIEYKVWIDGKWIVPDVIRVKRPDVSATYSDGSLYENCGFAMKITMDKKWNAKKVRVIANVGEKNYRVLSLNKRNLLKYKDENSFFHSIGEIIPVSVESGLQFDVRKKMHEKVEYEIAGWAFKLGETSAGIEYLVKDDQSDFVEIELQNRELSSFVKNRFFGKVSSESEFTIKFGGNTIETYTLIITDGESTVKKKINYKELYKTRKRKYRVILLKTAIRNLNASGVKRVIKGGFKMIFYPLYGFDAIYGISYGGWLKKHKAKKRELREQRSHTFQYTPKISILVPTYNTPINYLKEMVESVLNQTYSNWELCIADGSGGNKALEAVLKEYCRVDHRINFEILDSNRGIAGNTNEALNIASGEYVALLDHDDLLASDALFEVVKSLQEKRYDVIYTDEDKVSDDLKMYYNPYFKPDWSPDTLYSQNYISHLFVVKKKIIDEVGGFRSQYDGSQDYDIILRCTEKARSVHHIAKILYHWRVHPNSVAQNPKNKAYCYEVAKKAIESHYQSVGIKASVELMASLGYYRTIYETPGNPLVSIVLSNQDGLESLKKCIESLYEINAYKNIEIVVVENNSKKKETFDYYRLLNEKYNNLRIVTWEGMSNFSVTSNYGVSHAKGDFILFLNHKMKLIEPKSITQLLGCSMRKEVGIAGSKLLDEDDMICHAGIIIGLNGFAECISFNAKKNLLRYKGKESTNNNYSAVTGVGMMIKRSVFGEVGGFTEDYKVGLGDIDLCLKVRTTGRNIVFNANAVWYSYGFSFEGYGDAPESIEDFKKDVELFKERWQNILQEGDPYYNKNFRTDLALFKLGEV